MSLLQLVILTLGCVVGFGYGLLLPIAPGSPLDVSQWSQIYQKLFFFLLLKGRKWPPGSVWPLPYSQETTGNTFTFDPQSFKFIPVLSSALKDCPPLEFAIQKYSKQFLFKTVERIKPIPDPNFQTISEVTITITGGVNGDNECLNYPRLSDNPSVYEHCTFYFFQNVFVF